MTASLVGEFTGRAAIVDAARHLVRDGVWPTDAFTPMPIQELDTLLPRSRNKLLIAVMAGAGLIGAVTAFLFQYWAAAVEYPLNVGGRPLDSWPGFVPSAWEISALFTVYGGFIVLLCGCGLPRLFHPVFAVTHFDRATQDHFFLMVGTRADRSDTDRIRSVLEHHGALSVAEIAE